KRRLKKTKRPTQMKKQFKKLVGIVTQKLIILFVVITMLIQCNSPRSHPEEMIEYQKELSAELYKIRHEDSLRTILQQFVEEKNDVGKMICYKQLGSRQRENARFS